MDQGMTLELGKQKSCWSFQPPERHRSRISDLELGMPSEIVANFDAQALEVHNSSGNGIAELSLL